MTGTRRAIVASSNHWTSAAQLGSHHLARALVASGWDVAFLSVPISPFHLGTGLTPELRERWRLYRHGGMEEYERHLWAYVPGALLPPRRGRVFSARWIEHNWEHLAFPDPIGVLGRRGFGVVDLLLLDSPVHGYLLDRVRHRWSVLRIPDRLWAAPGTTPAMAQHLREIVSRVDLVAYTARSLLPELQAMRPRGVLHLPNGIDVDRFTEPGTPTPDLCEIERPIAIYVGAMDEWFDFDLVGELADALPAVSFVLIGPDRLARHRLSPRPNVHLLGRRPRETIPAYLAKADVGLIPFDVAKHGELVNAVHPLKLYEYFAAGLPVVATDWEELRMIGSPARLCSTLEQWVTAIDEAPRSVDPDRNRAFAAGNAWEMRVALLLRELERLG